MSEVIVRERYLKNGKKVYEYCFELAHEGGKRRRRTKSGFATKREARAAGRQALYEYENVGEVVVDNNISYSDFLDFWIENDCSNDCRKREGCTDTYKQGSLYFPLQAWWSVAVSSFFFTSISVLRVLLMWQFPVWHRLHLADSIPLMG